MKRMAGLVFGLGIILAPAAAAAQDGAVPELRWPWDTDAKRVEVRINDFRNLLRREVRMRIDAACEAGICESSSHGLNLIIEPDVISVGLTYGGDPNVMETFCGIAMQTFHEGLSAYFARQAVQEAAGMWRDTNGSYGTAQTPGAKIGILNGSEDGLPLCVIAPADRAQ